MNVESQLALTGITSVADDSELLCMAPIATPVSETPRNV